MLFDLYIKRHTYFSNLCCSKKTGSNVLNNLRSSVFFLKSNSNIISYTEYRHKRMFKNHLVHRDLGELFRYNFKFNLKIFQKYLKSTKYSGIIENRPKII